MTTEARLPEYPRDEVGRVFDGYPPAVRARMLRIRRILLDTAARLDAVGPLTEALRWGEPAYLTERTRSGSTIRLGWKPSDPAHCRILFHCRSTLVDHFRVRFPELSYEGNRAIVLPLRGRLPGAALRECLAQALTYHRRGSAGAVARPPRS
ncbi:MAG: DUF1801 domain-containing protein [Pseudomonadales bacterium]|jgi:hypothetical protein|nr:DUF1801 domain-containing protein [Pseudomonadales bacterium]